MPARSSSAAFAPCALEPCWLEPRLRLSRLNEGMRWMVDDMAQPAGDETEQKRVRKRLNFEVVPEIAKKRDRGPHRLNIWHTRGHGDDVLRRSYAIAMTAHRSRATRGSGISA